MLDTQGSHVFDISTEARLWGLDEHGGFWVEVLVAWSKVVAFRVLGSGRALIAARLIVGVHSIGATRCGVPLKTLLEQGVGTQVVDLIQKSCLDGEVSSCCMGHGDILVMDGQCQDEFLHCTDPGLEQERINVTFRWIKRHSVSCSLRTGNSLLFANVCAGFICCCYGGCWGWCIFGTLGAPWTLVQMRRCWLCLFSPSCLQDLGHGGVPIAGHAHWAEVGRGILCVTLGEFTGLHQNCAHFVLGAGL